MYQQYGLECPRCGDHIYSNSRHDFEVCRCGALFIDGGWDYMRAGGAGEGLTTEELRSAKKVSRMVDRRTLPWSYREERDGVPSPS